MVDYAKINEALERTRLEVRRKIMKEGAAAERASIVAWLWAKSHEYVAEGNVSDGGLCRGIAVAIERGDHAQPEPVRQEDGDV